MSAEYMHIGIPITNRKPGMTYNKDAKFWVSNVDDYDYKIEYLKFEGGPGNLRAHAGWCERQAGIRLEGWCDPGTVRSQLKKQRNHKMTAGAAGKPAAPAVFGAGQKGGSFLPRRCFSVIMISTICSGNGCFPVQAFSS